MTSRTTHHLHLDRRLTRRAVFQGGAALAAVSLAGCANDDGGGEPAPIAELPVAVGPTQVPPAPTQPPIGSPVAGYLDPTRWSGRSLVIASPAFGEYLDAVTIAFFDAFAMATGATVRHQDFGREGVAGVIDQVESGETVWDVLLVPGEEVLPLAQAGYLEPIDYNVVDPTALYAELMFQHGVGARMYSTTIVFPPAADPPANWTSFWDVSTTPGTRALRKSPIGTLEFALLADGVAMPDLYPLDTSRAFAALDRIRDTTIFYEDSKQPVELVRTGQVALASAWNVRTDLPDVVSLVSPQWTGGMVSADSWIIPRGAPNQDVGMSFINFATRAVPSANFSRLQSFGPVNQDALALLRPDIIERLPNAPGRLALQFFQNWGFWAEFRESLIVQFNDWLLNPVATPPARTRTFGVDR
ncbi:MAG: extracellular solute-binding protein [Chloroflexia bacterium]|nr:extracellular solute-binding protein [Chloroflexia bacterium]